ncbi:Maf protein [Entamoeba marina]
MLLEYLQNINKRTIILASASPRRKEILEKIGLKFEVQVSGFVENLNKADFPSAVEYVKKNASGKTNAVAEIRKDADLIIGCDTVVVSGDDILEKPKDALDASKILHRLSGIKHEVISVVCLVYPKIIIDNKPLTQVFHETTEVFFTEMSDIFIEKYISTGDCFGKAGAYGIQDNTAPSFVQKINGCYWNVMGFPAHTFSKHLVEVINKYWNN